MELTDKQKALIDTYDGYSLSELFALIGNEVAEKNDAALNDRYVFGTPNAQARGRKVVEDARVLLCARHKQLTAFAARNKGALDQAEWVAAILDFLLTNADLHGLPPFSVAVALGKLCNRQIEHLCRE